MRLPEGTFLASRSKVKGYRPFALIQLPVRVRISNPNEKFVKKLLNCRNNCQLELVLVNLMKGQWSPTCCTYTITS